MVGEVRLEVKARVAGEHPEAPRLDVAFAVADGITAIMGPSGAGKTTLLSTIAGLERPHDGRIVLDERILCDTQAGVFVPPHQRQVALVSQSLALFPHMTAWQNVAYGLSAPDRRARRERAFEWLARVHVLHAANRRPATLSGGEAQRVALARALAAGPRLLLLDEPFSALDEQLRARLGDEVQALVAAVAVPALLVTHDREDAARFSARTLVLDGGRLVSRQAGGQGASTRG